jgi:Tol biopolymer transport system component
LQPGTHVGPYKVLAALGAGGMGEVWRARDTRLGRDVAIKILPAEFAGDRNRLERFEQEARAVAALSHANILALHDVGTHEGLPYLITELLEGETLRERLRAGSLPVRKAIEYAVQVAHGLAAAHEKGIIHRDLKPENLFIGEDGRVKILDFGLAKLRQDETMREALASATTRSALTQAGMVMGTVSYMAPEQVRGEAADQRSDIFALGAVVYEMLFGRPAFSQGTVADTITAILREDPPGLDEHSTAVPPLLRQIVRRCLEKRPRERFSSAHDLAFALESASTVVSGDARPSSTRRRAWLRWSAVGALAVVVVAAVIWRVVSTRGEERLPQFSPRRVTSGPGLKGEPAISPGGSEIAYTVTENGHTSLFLTDVRGGTPLLLTTRAGKESDPAWFPDGTAIAFTSDEDGGESIWRINRLGGEPTLLLRDARQPAISPDGMRIAFARAGTSGQTRIWVAPLADLAAARALTGDNDGAFNHEQPAWSPGGATICYHDQRDLWLVPADGGKATRLLGRGAQNLAPVWSCDGRHVYFASYREGTLAIWRISVRGGAPTRVTLGTGPEQRPTLSRDGRMLAYTTARQPNTVVLVDLRKGTRVPIQEAQYVGLPTIAPDRSALVYNSDREGTYDLWRMPLWANKPAGPAVRLTQLEGTTACPAFSPDGRWLAFFRVVAGQRDVWVMPSEGGAPSNFSGLPGSAVQPEWSPDGSRIAFCSDRGGSQQFWVAPVRDGRRNGEARQLTFGEGSVSYCAWSPDGASLAYVREDANGHDVWLTALDGTSPPRRLTHGANASRIVWVHDTGTLLVAGGWGTTHTSIRVVPLDGAPPMLWRTAGPTTPNSEIKYFSVSPDGTLLALQEAETDARGDVWVLEVDQGTF